MPLRSSISPLLSNRRSSLAINGLIESLRKKDPSIAQAFTELQSAVNSLEYAARQPQSIDALTILDPNGVPLAYIGPFVVNGIGYSGACFARVWIGAGANPATAPFFCDGSSVIIGKNGVIYVQDAGGNTGATLGVTTDPGAQVITAATNVAPSVITITGHGYVTGDTVYIAGATGNTAINGYRIVVRIDADTFSTTTLAGVAVNGNGALTNNATCQRYYAGVLAQTFATGQSFANYKLRAFANGALKINGAEISVSGTLSSIVINPDTGTLTITEAGTSPVRRTTLASGQVVIDWDATSTEKTTIVPGALYLTQGGANNYGDNLLMGLSSAKSFTTEAGSEMVTLYGYSGVTAFGPQVAFYQSRGTGETATKTMAGDTVGGLLGYGFDGVAGREDVVAGIRFEATEDHNDSTHRGTKVVISSVPTASGTASEVLVVKDDKVGVNVAAPGYALDVTGDVNMSGVPRIGGTPGVDKSATRVTSITPTTAVIQYKDWAGTNQQMTVVTNVGYGTATDTVTKGIVTA